jgi:large subunit ribosomal protein L10
MSKTRVQKTELLNEYKEILKNKGGYLLVNSDKTDTKTTTGLKIKLKDVGANYEVLKNSIFKIALQETDQPVQVQDFDGPTAIIFFDEDLQHQQISKRNAKRNRTLRCKIWCI